MKWISIVDALPNEGDEVIVYFKNKVGWHVGGFAIFTGSHFIVPDEI